MSPSDPITTVVPIRGQVILPRAICQHRNWSAGTSLVVEETRDGVLLRPASAFPPACPEDVFARLRHRGAPLSVEEMDAAVLAAARRRRDRD